MFLSGEFKGSNEVSQIDQENRNLCLFFSLSVSSGGLGIFLYDSVKWKRSGKYDEAKNHLPRSSFSLIWFQRLIVLFLLDGRVEDEALA